MYQVPKCLGIRRLRGFTIVELMIAVLIVGVLAAIAIPAYNRYRDRIDRAKAINDIRVLQLLISDQFASGGALPASLADVGNAGMLDPWGNPYVYVDVTGPGGKGKARKDHKLNPINSDFDLYSMGKDGESKSQLTQKSSLDDIVRARDGAFVGLAADFSP
jgi:general secretion pathway protein G